VRHDELLQRTDEPARAVTTGMMQSAKSRPAVRDANGCCMNQPSVMKLSGETS
jgi:hypothetical protein